MHLKSSLGIVGFICSYVIVALSGCDKKEPIRIGYIGSLVSATGDLGLSGREGAILAVEQHNKRTKNQQIDLITVNDAQKQQDLEASILSLIDDKVNGMIGPMTSSMAQFALPLINQYHLLTISPTSSSWYLDGLDDYLFRVYPSSKAMGASLAEYVVESEIRTMGIIKDLDNATHTEAFAQVFKDTYESHEGSKVIFNLTYRNSDKPVFSLLLGEIEPWPEGLLILCNSSDSALICQQLKKRGLDIRVFASEWSASPTVFMMGGDTVEGLIVVSAIDPSRDNENYRAFEFDFRNRFDREADFAAVMSYDATNMLIEALLSGKNPKRYLLNKDQFMGLQGPFSFDKHGDPVRKISLIRAVDGKFETIR